MYVVAKNVKRARNLVKGDIVYGVAGAKDEAGEHIDLHSDMRILTVRTTSSRVTVTFERLANGNRGEWMWSPDSELIVR
jgi:hypothetical protein